MVENERERGDKRGRREEKERIVFALLELMPSWDESTKTTGAFMFFLLYYLRARAQTSFDVVVKKLK